MKPGEKLKLSDLLYGLMMISANDSAYAIADATDGGFDKFISLANEKVTQLGLNETVMKNPAGLDEAGQTSSAFDLATITSYALKKHPSVIKYAGKTTEHSVQMTEHNEPHWWFGHLSRMLMAYKPMVAAKTGFTDEAGNTYIGIAEKGDRRLVLVILGSNSANANNDVKSLLDYGFSKSQ
jgi:D-alanyl-D-alanine carboxypeptidase